MFRIVTDTPYFVTDADTGKDVYIVTDKEKSQAAKNYLSQIASTDALINQLQDTVYRLRASLTSQSYALQPDKVQTSGPKDTISATVEKIVDYEADITRRIDELVDLKRKAAAIIEKIPDLNQQTVLIGHYISGKSWGLLSAEMNYCIQNLYKIHGKALLAFFEVMPKE